jgi:DNA repair photolyase
MRTSHAYLDLSPRLDFKNRLIAKPHVADLLRKELDKPRYQYRPIPANRILQRIRDLRSGKLNDSTFGQRMRGQGQYADLIAQRFRLACKRLELNTRSHQLDTSQFKPPHIPEQMELF